MTSQKQLDANRQNALKSTGPKTAVGKDIVRLNAISHGATAEISVIPFMENQEDWEAHRTGLYESLTPSGYFETLLVERIASLMWRLRRVARYELEVIALEQESTKDIIYGQTSPDTLSKQLESAREFHKLLERFLKMKDKSRIKSVDATEILYFIADIDEAVDIEELDLPDLPDDVDFETFSNWTAGLLRQCIVLIGDAREETYEYVINTARHQAVNAIIELERQIEQIEAKLKRSRRMNLLPKPHVLHIITRYEVHLERSLYKVIGELEKFQTARMTKPIEIPVIDANRQIENGSI